MVKHLKTIECPRCHKLFEQHAWHHAHCTTCSYEITNEKRSAYQRAKRAAAKAAKENQAS